MGKRFSGRHGLLRHALPVTAEPATGSIWQANNIMPKAAGTRLDDDQPGGQVHAHGKRAGSTQHLHAREATKSSGVEPHRKQAGWLGRPPGTVQMAPYIP